MFPSQNTKDKKVHIFQPIFALATQFQPIRLKQLIT